MVGDRVALPGRAVIVEGDGALPVEVCRRFISVEVLEDGRQGFSSIENAGRFGAVTVHIDGEDGVVGTVQPSPIGR